MPRCAGALATLPVVLNQRPDACVIWFDAHADLHLPSTTTSSYLGGMALSGPLGWWDSGFGSGAVASNITLAGTRDIDPAEQRLVRERGITTVAPGPGFVDRLADAVGERAVYIHLDCDVLEPGIVPTDYHVPGGLDLTELHACALALTRLDIVGLEIAEFEDTPEEGTSRDIDSLLDALTPLLDLTAGQRPSSASHTISAR
jgi:arginase family enzyme